MAKSTPIISIIIPHWNGIEILSECINSLQKTEFDSFEIIVCDNASTDGSQQWLKENHNQICLLYTSPSPRDATLSRMPSSA